MIGIKYSLRACQHLIIVRGKKNRLAPSTALQLTTDVADINISKVKRDVNITDRLPNCGNRHNNDNHC